MDRRLGRFAVVLVVAAALALVLPAAAHALTLRQGNTVTVPAGETVNDDLYAFGSTVVIEGTVNGDVVTAGQSVLVGGHVSGGVMAAGQTVRVTGTVGGSVRAAGQSVAVTGDTAQDAVLAGSDVGLTGRVGRDVAGAGNTVTIAGPVGRNALLSGNAVSIAAPVSGSVTAQAERLRVLPGGSVGGNLEYTSASTAQIQGPVRGRTVRHVPVTPRRERGGAAAGFLFGLLAWLQGLVGVAVFGIVAILLFPRAYRDAAFAVFDRPWPSIGLGLALFFGVPFLATFVFVIGLFVGVWWLSFVLLALYWIGLIAAMVVAALALGRAILRGPASHGLHDVWSMLLGLLIIWVIVAIPFVGWLVGWAALLFGLGGLAIGWSRHRHEHAAPMPPYQAPAAPAQQAYPPPAYAPAPAPQPYPPTQPMPPQPMQSPQPPDPAAPTQPIPQGGPEDPRPPSDGA